MKRNRTKTSSGSGTRMLLPLLFAILSGCGPGDEKASESAGDPAASQEPSAKQVVSLDRAIAMGDLDAVVAAINRNPDSVNEGENPNLPPLSSAILRKRVEIAKTLIEAGADPSRPDSSGRTPAHLAVERNLPELIQPLADAGGQLSELDGNAGWTPLHWATAKDQLEMARALIQAGADLEKRSKLGGTVLHEAASTGSGEMVTLVLESGVDPAIVSGDGRTALMVAEDFKNEEAIKILSQR